MCIKDGLSLFSARVWNGGFWMFFVVNGFVGFLFIVFRGKEKKCVLVCF